MVKLCKKYGKKYLFLIILNVVIVIGQSMVQTIFLMGKMKDIIDNGVAAQNFDYILKSGIWMLAYTVVIILCSIATSYITAKVVTGMICDIRRDCFMKSSNMSVQELNLFGSSTLFTRTLTDPQQVQIMLINMMKSILLVPFLLVFMLINIFILNKSLFVVLFIMFLITIFVIIAVAVNSKKHFGELQEKVDRINLLVSEKIGGARAIRAFRNQNYEEERLSQANQDAYDVALKANYRIAYITPLATVFMNWIVVAIYLLGSFQLKSGFASISDLLLVFNYVGYFINSLAVIQLVENLLPRTVVAAERINELLDAKTEHEANKEQNLKKEGITNGEVEFDHVIFGYDGAVNVIADVSFTAKAGKTTAIIGSTGSGKSTILNLLTGLYTMNFGDIRIDGVSVRQMDKDYVRSRIAYCTQKAMVFTDTVYNNITAYNKNIDKERVETACKAAKFDEVIQKLPKGLETVMAKGGMNISGGQRQRLSLARCIAKDAAVYIFDDTFSALDAKTEAAARKSVAELLKGKTVFMVAQKISTIIDADQIIVLDNGKIAGCGTHEELLKECSIYQEIYETQYYMKQEMS